MTRVYIGDLGDSGSRYEIEKECERFGPLREVWVARNPPGFGFVLFEHRRDAEDAVRALDGRRMCGVKVRVELAKGPTRGGKRRNDVRCYECGRIGHSTQECTRRPGYVYRGPKGRTRRRSR